jgi:tetratricopeptide (TPR) repeat protein
MNTQQDRIVQIIALCVVTLCMIASLAVSTSLTTQASRAQLSYTDESVEGAPPEVAIGMAMGAFRGMFVNYLWLRANELKEDGKFYEAIELSRTITRLQPRFPRVWVFHAWNMAYNISVATQTADERWAWVNAGIALLRDEAIPQNPTSVLLHRELAWMFLHKIQGFADDANRYYKRELAREWTYVLGTPPGLPSDPTRAQKILVDWLDPIVNAPATLEELIERERQDFLSDPQNRADNRPFESKVAQLVEEIKTKAGLDLGKDLLRFVAIEDAYVSQWEGQERLLGMVTTLRLNEIIGGLRRDPQYARAWERLLPFVRRKVLAQDYRMEPARMQRYTQHIGPLDWRHPASHAIYWAYRGIEQSRDRQSTTTFDTLNTDRMITHSIQELYRSGTVLYDIFSHELVTFIDTNWVDCYHRMLENEIRVRGGSSQDSSIRSYTTFSAGYENFLRDVIRTYYRMGDMANARRYYEQLRTYEHLNYNDSTKFEEQMLPLDDFVRKQMRDRLSTPHVVASEVYSSILDGLLRGLLRNDAEHFRNTINYARELHRMYFQEEQTVRNLVDKDHDRMEQLPRDFSEAVAATLVQLLGTGVVPPVQASQIYRRLPEPLQQLTYDPLIRVYASHGVPLEAAQELIPEPPNMAAFRAQRQAIQKGSFEDLRRGVTIERQ